MKKLLFSIVLLSLFFAVACTTNQSEPGSSQQPIVGQQSKQVKKSGQAMDNLTKVPDFSVKDLDGNIQTNEIFKDNKLTIINIWATFCGPCIVEMPELQELYETYKPQSVNLIGLVSDSKGNENTAQQIIDSNGVEFTNLLADDNLIMNLANLSQYVPTTIFVDKDGNRVGEVVIGSVGIREYTRAIEAALEEIQ